MAVASHQLEQLVRLVEERLGLNLNRGGLLDALRAYAERSTESLELVREGDQRSAAFQRLVDAVTVQHSWLFRDRQQLEVACSTLERTHGASGVCRVWVPACASGEDAYSIATLCGAKRLTIELLGSDVNASAIESARRGCYGPWAARSVPPSHQSMLAPEGPSRRVVAHVRQRVRFVVHNLLDPPPHSDAPGGLWDLVVCRNVLIYLSRSHAARVLDHLRKALAPGGALVLGASDILAEVPSGLTAQDVAGRVVFGRTEDRESGRQRALSIRPVRALNGSSNAAVKPTPGGDRERRKSGPRNGGTSVTASGAASGFGAPSKQRVATHAAPTERFDRDAEEAISHLLDGIACHLSGDLQRAVTRLRAALFLMPELWPASYYLALTYDGLGRRDEARREYVHAIHSIEEGRPLPILAGQEFSFLCRDVARIARRRARGQ